MTRNVMNFERTPQAEEQARSWVVRIDASPLGAEERQQLHEWLAEDPNHPRLLDEHALLWATASRARFPTLESAAARIAAPSFVGSRPRWAWVFGALGGLGSVALASLLWLNSPWSPSVEDGRSMAATYKTAVGQPRPVPLPDGSRTELNAASTLRVAYSPERRRVVLERGEGLFEVAKDRSRPFEVVAGDTVVRAVGTRFLVQRHANGSAEITVYEGVVEVTRAAAVAARSGAQPLRLGVGQVAVSAERHVLLAQAEPQAMGRKLAWQQGRLEFDRTPLAEALEEVNRYSLVPIRLGDATLRETQVSGSFSTQDIPVFLRSLEQGFGLRAERSADSWVLSRAESR
ncbi:FecR family protein [Roseateles cavernae]|uniref:FecR family protein n=1 Tax=Roseateles cavernae TaxID=3153578 RepID=UPI0032E4636C